MMRVLRGGVDVKIHYRVWCGSCSALLSVADDELLPLTYYIPYRYWQCPCCRSLINWQRGEERYREYTPCSEYAIKRVTLRIKNFYGPYTSPKILPRSWLTPFEELGCVND